MVMLQLTLKRLDKISKRDRLLHIKMKPAYLFNFVFGTSTSFSKL
jgi:hypothetical protein